MRSLAVFLLHHRIWFGVLAGLSYLFLIVCSTMTYLMGPKLIYQGMRHSPETLENLGPWQDCPAGTLETEQEFHSIQCRSGSNTVFFIRGSYTQIKTRQNEQSRWNYREGEMGVAVDWLVTIPATLAHLGILLWSVRPRRRLLAQDHTGLTESHDASERHAYGTSATAAPELTTSRESTAAPPRTAWIARADEFFALFLGGIVILVVVVVLVLLLRPDPPPRTLEERRNALAFVGRLLSEYESAFGRSVFDDVPPVKERSWQVRLLSGLQSARPQIFTRSDLLQRVKVPPDGSTPMPAFFGTDGPTIFPVADDSPPQPAASTAAQDRETDPVRLIEFGDLDQTLPPWTAETAITFSGNPVYRSVSLETPYAGYALRTPFRNFHVLTRSGAIHYVSGPLDEEAMAELLRDANSLKR